MKNKKKILLYGGKSTALIVSEMLKDDKERPKYIYDEYIKNPEFKSSAKFSNKKKDLKLFIKNSSNFFICIGMMDGKLRNYISNLFIKEKLKQ